MIMNNYLNLRELQEEWFNKEKGLLDEIEKLKKGSSETEVFLIIIFKKLPFF